MIRVTTIQPATSSIKIECEGKNLTMICWAVFLLVAGFVVSLWLATHGAPLIGAAGCWVTWRKLRYIYRTGRLDAYRPVRCGQ